MTEHRLRGDQEADADPAAARRADTFRERFRDAVEPRTLAVVMGAGLLCLGFVLSYMGAFHAPQPHRIPITVVAPGQAADRLAADLDAIEGEPLDATVAPDEATAVERLRDAETSAVLVVDPTARQDRLLVASGTGASLESAVQRVVTSVEAQRQRSVAVEDIVAHQPGDAQSVSGFYLTVGCVLAGYLLAAALGMAKGNRPATFQRTLWRLGTAVPYAVLVGLGAAVIADPVLSALTGHFGELWLVGALLVLAAATVTMAFQVMFGIIGIGVTIIVFVILGNPSAGGAYPLPLLPPFWAAIGPWLPNGAGVEALRRAVYFGGAGIAGPLWVLVVWTVGGAALAILAAHLRSRRLRGGLHREPV